MEPDSVTSCCAPKMISTLNGDWLVAAITFYQVFSSK